MAKIMNLVDPRLLERLAPIAPVNPVHKTISDLDRDMKQILDQPDISDREKVTQYNQTLQRYLDYYHKPTPPLPQVTATSPSSIEEEITGVIPKTLRGKAHTLLQRIKRDPHMGWNDRGEFVYQGQTMPGTNIVDLVSNAVRHRKTMQAHRWQEFARGLRQSNVPQDLIGNANMWNWMHRESASSDAFSTADEGETTPPRTSRPSRPIPRAGTQKRSVKRTRSMPASAIKKAIKWDES